MSQQASTTYRVLARKYRPETFADLIGQEALVRTLSNALAMNRLAHAFVLTGVRGIGKTSTARLLAKGLNCIGEDGQGSETLEPCGQCEPCQAIGSGRHVDVLEIDAASHTGVDDVREIIEGVGYRPVSARYKIYIIDEVHMMSKNAFNALLKTLEEPPASVKFIFATTEIRKVPVTILSRCQRFDLRRVSADQLQQHLQKICSAEAITSDAGALHAIAIAAEGSVRDALSMLDQAAAMTADSLTEAAVNDMLGRPGRADSLNILQKALAGDAAGALGGFAHVHRNGAEAEMVVADLLEIVHQASLAAAGAGVEDLNERDRDAISALGTMGIARLGRAWQLLLKGHGEVSSAPSPAAALEMLLIRLAHAANMPTPTEILQKLPTAPTQKAAAKESGSAGENSGRNSGSDLQPGPVASSPADHNPPPQRVAEGGGRSAPEAQTVAVAESLADDMDAAGTPTVTVTSLADIAALAEDNDEALLAARVRTHLRLVAIQPGSLEVALAERAPDSLAGDLARYLSQWTGRRWLVSVSDRPGSQTLAEEQAERSDRLKTEIAETPLVKSVLAMFPGATIESIRPTKIDPALTPDDPDDGDPGPQADEENGQ